MLAKRIIPCLDVKGGRVVKGVSFVNLRDAGDPVAQARAYAEAGADELTFLDIGASVEQRGTLVEMVERVANALFIPFTVGGGVRTPDDFRALLRAGADKVSINTAAVEIPGLIAQVTTSFGSQCVVVAIDAARDDALRASFSTTDEQQATTGPTSSTIRGSDSGHSPPSGGLDGSTKLHWKVFIHGGRKNTGRDAVEWAREVESEGAGEILLTSIDRDGTQMGFDLELTRIVAQAVNIPVIASGGAGRLEDFALVLTEGKADAALAASLFHDRVLTIDAVKQYLHERGIEVRGVENGIRSSQFR